MFAAYGGRTLANSKPFVKAEPVGQNPDQLRKDRRQIWVEEALSRRDTQAKELAERKRLANEAVAAGRAVALRLRRQELEERRRMKIDRLHHVQTVGAIVVGTGYQHKELPRQVRSYYEIESRICRALGVRASEVRSNRRDKRVSFARQAISYWACRLTDYSLPHIGRMLGGKDHTSVLWGKRQYVVKRAAQGRTLREVR